MFTRIQARHFRCLKQIDQPLGRFQALVGPNASGKTTFLDVMTLLSDLMKSRGVVAEALGKRSSNFSKLLWKGRGSSFLVAVEAKVPRNLTLEAGKIEPDQKFVRYEIVLALDKKTNEIRMEQEVLWLIPESNKINNFISLKIPDQIASSDPNVLQRLTEVTIKNAKMNVFLHTINSGDDREVLYRDETGDTWFLYGFLRGRSALANIPPDPERFPVTLWFQGMLERGVQSLVLDNHKIRQPSPPGLGMSYQADGSNLPWVIDELAKDSTRFTMWIDHVRTSLEDVRTIRTVERKEDRHRYLVVQYTNGVSVPSWLVSDGTLRLLALTILPYLKEVPGVLLVEEPENGIHPKAIETVVQSLTSVYHSQVLIATHSPIIVNQLEPAQILCFAKDKSGATHIISADRHPRLTDWKTGRPSMGTLLASGILD